MIRLLSALLAILLLVGEPASAAVVQITVNDRNGTSRSFSVTTNSDATGNLVPNQVICDQAVGTTCASVGTAGSPSTNALTVQSVTLGNGTSANAARVTLSNDSTGTVVATQPTGSNLHSVIDSGTLTTVSTVSASRLVGNGGAILDGATGAAVPANVIYLGVNNSGNLLGWPAKTASSAAPSDVVPEVAVANANANGRAISGSSSPVVLTPSLSTFHLIAAASTNATSVKGSGATLYGCQLTNNSTTPAYLKIYNKASSPTVGTDVPVKTIIIPGPAAGGGGNNPVFGPGGLTLATGFALALTGVITDADTTAVAATAFAVNCDYE